MQLICSSQKVGKSPEMCRMECRSGVSGEKGSLSMESRQDAEGPENPLYGQRYQELSYLWPRWIGPFIPGFLAPFAGKHFFFLLFYGHATWHLGSLFPDQGSNLHFLQWKCSILATGPPEKPQDTFSTQWRWNIKMKQHMKTFPSDSCFLWLSFDVY